MGGNLARQAMVPLVLDRGASLLAWCHRGKVPGGLAAVKSLLTLGVHGCSSWWFWSCNFPSSQKQFICQQSKVWSSQGRQARGCTEDLRLLARFEGAEKRVQRQPGSVVRNRTTEEGSLPEVIRPLSRNVLPAPRPRCLLHSIADTRSSLPGTSLRSQSTPGPSWLPGLLCKEKLKLCCHLPLL